MLSHDQQGSMVIPFRNIGLTEDPLEKERNIFSVYTNHFMDQGEKRRNLHRRR